MLNFPASFLIAETRMAEVSLQYREEAASNGTSGWWYLLIPFAAVGIALVIHYIGSRPPAIVNTPDGLLHELCKVHRLSTSGRILLELIADEAELAHPATLFLGEMQFDEAVRKIGDRITYDRHQQATLAVLRRRLFGR